MEREGLVQSEVRFSRREVREWTRWSSTQVRLHLERLEELEYVLVHRVGRAGRGVVVMYELAYAGEGEDGAPFVVGLSGYDGELAGVEGQLAWSKRGQNGPKTVGYRGGDGARNSGEEARSASSTTNGAGKAHPGSASEIGSYA
jgi:hypothetical protein